MFLLLMSRKLSKGVYDTGGDCTRIELLRSSSKLSASKLLNYPLQITLMQVLVRNTNPVPPLVFFSLLH